MGCARRSASRGMGGAGGRWRAIGGVTLVELLVVLAVLGATTAIVGLAWRRAPWGAEVSGHTGTVADIEEARSRALETGASVTVRITDGGVTFEVTALPDGRVIGADRWGYDPLSGRPAAPARGAR